ncbi:hypothetical protein CKA32_000702 [Geitlerinema sp. FC II]|nr:hypothetical protein CKA32_000702 [Geitlerinema sp. FC II]
MGFSTKYRSVRQVPIVVSIPRRDFWVFQLHHVHVVIVHISVSIPRRDFWVFQLLIGRMILQ